MQDESPWPRKRCPAQMPPKRQRPDEVRLSAAASDRPCADLDRAAPCERWRSTPSAFDAVCVRNCKKTAPRLTSSIGAVQHKLVGATGFDPATSCSQSRRATKLRHATNAYRCKSPGKSWQRNRRDACSKWVSPRKQEYGPKHKSCSTRSALSPPPKSSLLSHRGKVWRHELGRRSYPAA